MTVSASCNNCGGSVDPSRDEACPHCGQYAGKTIGATVNDRIGIRDTVSESLSRAREFLQYHRGWAVLLAVIVLISPFIGEVIAGVWGTVVGLLLGILSIPVGFFAVTKVREITREDH